MTWIMPHGIMPKMVCGTICAIWCAVAFAQAVPVSVDPGQKGNCYRGSVVKMPERYQNCYDVGGWDVEFQNIPPGEIGFATALSPTGTTVTMSVTGKQDGVFSGLAILGQLQADLARDLWFSARMRYSGSSGPGHHALVMFNVRTAEGASIEVDVQVAGNWGRWSEPLLPYYIVPPIRFGDLLAWTMLDGLELGFQSVGDRTVQVLIPISDLFDLVSADYPWYAFPYAQRGTLTAFSIGPEVYGMASAQLEVSGAMVSAGRPSLAQLNSNTARKHLTVRR